jgi:hypothetical protein
MNDNFRINIARPYPETKENEQQISFIEPLRKDGRVLVSNAYHFNLAQYTTGKEPSLSPGFRYEFEFFNTEDALAFKLKFGGEEVK